MTNEWTSHLVQIFEKKKGEFEFHFYIKKNNLIWWDLYIALAVVLLSIWMLFILFSVHSTTTFSLVFFLFFLPLLRVRYSPLTFNIFLPHPIAFFLLSSRTFSMLYKASGAHTRYLSIICSLTSPTFFFRLSYLVASNNMFNNCFFVSALWLLAYWNYTNVVAKKAKNVSHLCVILPTATTTTTVIWYLLPLPDLMKSLKIICTQDATKILLILSPLHMAETFSHFIFFALFINRYLV